MGWKAFAKKFDIKHIVIVNAKENCVTIRSSFLSNIVSFSLKTGELIPNNYSTNFLEENYPELAKASPEEILALFKEEDVFEKNIPIYHYDFETCDVHERFCEDPSYPNVTHDGFLIYENTFSTDKNAMIAYGEKSIKEDIYYSEKREEELKETLQKTIDRKKAQQDCLKEFKEKYGLQ